MGGVVGSRSDPENYFELDCDFGEGCESTGGVPGVGEVRGLSGFKVVDFSRGLQGNFRRACRF